MSIEFSYVHLNDTWIRSVCSSVWWKWRRTFWRIISDVLRDSFINISHTLLNHHAREETDGFVRESIFRPFFGMSCKLGEPVHAGRARREIAGLWCAHFTVHWRRDEKRPAQRTHEDGLVRTRALPVVRSDQHGSALLTHMRPCCLWADVF